MNIMRPKHLRIPSIALAIVVSAPSVFSQTGTWVQRADFEGFARGDAAAFSIGGTGYVTTGGYVFQTMPNDAGDTWAYNAATNTWVQKADFGGGVRFAAAAFSINGIGYVVGGAQDGVVMSDLWAYDPVGDTWTQKASCPGTARSAAVAFSIGNTGYMGLGLDENANTLADFWAYDPALDSWSQLNDMAGGARAYAIGFSIGDKGYVGLGGAVSTYMNDFWEYDPVNDAWTARASYPGVGRHSAIAFGTSTTGYAGTGIGESSILQDFYSYDPVSDTWTNLADYPPGVRTSAAAFVINGSGYVVSGRGLLLDTYPDVWRYDPVVSTGIHDENEASIALYPQPAHDALHWTSPCPVLAEVLDLEGKRLFSTQVSSGPVRLDLSNLPAGTYFLHTQEGIRQWSQLFVKE